MMASRVGGRLRGNRIVGLALPQVSSRVFPWKEMDAPLSWAPFETVYQAGPVLLPTFGNDLDPERRIDAVRVLRMLRAEGLVIAVGCDALTGRLEAGSFVIIDDHVNWTGENPLRGPNDERLGPRYPDMSEPYDASWASSLRRGAALMGLDLRSAVYGRVGRTGVGDERAAGDERAGGNELAAGDERAGCNELAAGDEPAGGDELAAGDEFAAWAQAGIDVVGEGLLDEVIAAVHCGLPVAAVGLVEKGWQDGENALCSSAPARSEDYARLAELINQCILCRGGMDDG